MSNNTETMNANGVLRALEDAFPEVGQMRWDNSYFFETYNRLDDEPIEKGVKEFMSKLGSDWCFNVEPLIDGNCGEWKNLIGFVVHITNDVELAKLRDE